MVRAMPSSNENRAGATFFFLATKHLPFNIVIAPLDNRVYENQRKLLANG